MARALRNPGCCACASRQMLEGDLDLDEEGPDLPEHACRYCGIHRCAPWRVGQLVSPPTHHSHTIRGRWTALPLHVLCMRTISPHLTFTSGAHAAAASHSAREP